MLINQSYSGKYIAMAEQFAKELELPILDVMEIRH